MYVYLDQSADGSELLRVERKRRSLAEPVVDESQLTLVPVEDKVGQDLGHQVLGQSRERGGQEQSVAAHWNTALHLGGGKSER